MRKTSKWLLSAAAGAIAGAAVPACAQDAPAETSASDAGTGNEIVVTAQKRSEALQDVPIAISAFAGDTLAKQGVQGIMDLAKVTPSLLITEGSSQAQPFIRGVGGRNITPGNEATTAVYIDGVYQTDKTGLMLQGFPDVQSVQVLRGPQGTLFGRNATSGAILVTTKKPSQEFGAFAEGTLGTDEAGGRLFVTAPIAPTLSFAASGFYRDQYDYIKNLNPSNGAGKRVGGDLGYGVRGTLLWEPSSDFSASLAGYWAKGHNNAPMAVQPVRGGPTTLGGALAQSILGLDISRPDRAYYGEIPPEVRYEGYGASLTLDADLGIFDLKSITAYHHDNSGVQLDLDASPIPVFWFDTDLNGRAYQQEINLTSNGSGPFQWIVGGFYINYRDGYSQQDQVVGLPVPNPLRPHQVPQSLLDAAAAGEAPGGKVFIDQSAFVTVESLGIFGEASYQFTDSTKLTVGVRYTDETSTLDKDNGNITYTPDGAGGLLAIPGSSLATCEATPTCTGLKTPFQKVTYRAVLDQKFSDDVMGYLSYNRGFKSGVYNISTITNVEATKPEIIDAIEAGLKVTAFDRKLTFNAAAYYYKYKNLQVAIVDPDLNTQISINAAKATISGLEIETGFHPNDRLNLNASFSTFFNAQYDEFPACLIYRPNGAGLSQIPGADADCSGTRLPVTPKVMASLTGSYTIPLPNDAKIELGGLYSHISRFDHAPYGFYAAGVDETGTPYPAGIGRAPIQKAINTVNLYATFTPPDDKFYVQLWAKDILNQNNVYRNLFTTSFGYYTSLTRGISGGVSVGFKFGSERR